MIIKGQPIVEINSQEFLESTIFYFKVTYFNFYIFARKDKNRNRQLQLQDAAAQISGVSLL